LSSTFTQQLAGEAKKGGLDRDQHEERLEADDWLVVTEEATMRKARLGGLFGMFAAALAAALSSTAKAEELSNTDLAKLAQNPIANLITIPFQSNTNFNVGQYRGIQENFQVQPVIPFSLSNNWNFITRTILPFLSNPALSPSVGAVGGMGDVQMSGFLSPAAPGDWIWGVGPIIQLPTHTANTLGNNNLGLGPTGVLLHVRKGDPWVFGALINNVFSVGTSPTAPAYNIGLLEPFINYNFGDGLYIVSAPIILMDWLAPAGQQLLLPLGGGIGKIFHLGKLPVNAEIEAYYNVVRPNFAPDWQLRVQIKFMFPK